jgi:hypothetical protein
MAALVHLAIQTELDCRIAEYCELSQGLVWLMPPTVQSCRATPEEDQTNPLEMVPGLKVSYFGLHIDVLGAQGFVVLDRNMCVGDSENLAV